MKLNVKNMPKLSLFDLLKRRKMGLKQYMDEFGITTHEGLVSRCTRMGVIPPDEATFAKVVPALPVVNNPSEGIVIVEPTVERKRPGPGLLFLPDVESLPVSGATQPDEQPEGPLSGSSEPLKRPKKKKDSNNHNDQ